MFLKQEPVPRQRVCIRVGVSNVNMSSFYLSYIRHSVSTLLTIMIMASLLRIDIQVNHTMKFNVFYYRYFHIGRQDGGLAGRWVLMGHYAGGSGCMAAGGLSMA